MKESGKVPVIAEITTPFGTRRIPVAQVDWDGLRAMKQFYQSPAGLSMLAEYDDEENQFVREQQSAGIEAPTRLRFGLPTVAVRLITEDGEVLTSSEASEELMGGESENGTVRRLVEQQD